MKKCKKLLGIITAFAFVMATIVPSQAYAVAVSADKIDAAGGLIKLVDPVRVTGNVYPTTTSLYDLGTSALYWDTLFTRDVSFLPKSAASTTSEGYVYYDSDDDNLYVYANSAWVDLTAGAAGTPTLDDSYNNDSGERTVLVEAGDVSWDMSSSYNYVLDMQGTGDIIFQDNGTAAFTFADAGAATFAGTAEGTAVLTLTAGDIVVTDGDVTLSGGELSVTTDDTANDAATIAGNTLTTGQALAIVYDASTHSSGNIFEISDADAGVDFAVAEDGVTTITGSAEGTSAFVITAGDAVVTNGDITVSSGELSLTTDDTSTDAITVAGNTLTTGQALAIVYDASTHSSGNVFEVSDADAGVDFAIAEDGATTLTGTAEGTSVLTLTTGDLVVTDGDLTITAGEVAATTDDTATDGFTINGNTLTTGQALAITYDASTHSSGNVIELADNDAGVDFAVAEDGATTITGSAEGTNALTLTLGDLVITDGDLTLSGGEVSITSSATGTSPLAVASVADSTVGPVDLAPDMVSGTILDLTVTGAPVLSGALLGIVIDLSNAVENTNDQATTGVKITMAENDASAVDTRAVDLDGAADYGIDMDGLTAGSAEILLTNAETIANTANGSITLSDGTNTMIFDIDATEPQLLVSKDASIATTDGTNDTLELDPFATGAGFVIGGGAGEDYLGSTTIEWKGAYIGDDTGINFGLGQDALLAYDETTDDRMELTGTGATLYVEDVLTLGKQAETINGADQSVTVTASYLEVTATAATDDIILATTNVTEGDILIVVNVAANTFQVDGGTATMKIDGGADLDVAQYGTIMFVFDGTNWCQIGKIPTNT